MPSYNQYKRQVAVLDADNSEIETWITVRGNHIPIKKGQSKEEAVKSFIESKGGKYKKESYGKHYVRSGEKGDEKYVDPRTDTLHREKSEVGFFGSEKEAKEYAHKLNHTDPYAGTPFAVKNYKRTIFPYEVESEKEKKDNSFVEYTIPDDYKKSVANYTKEKHEQAAKFYGEKMASVQKKANNENDPNVDTHRKHFEEYQTLSNWHAEQAKGEKKEQMPTSYQIEEAFREVGLKHKWEHVKYRLDMHGIDEYTVKEFIDSGLFQPEDIIEALESRSHNKIDAMVKATKKKSEDGCDVKKRWSADWKKK